MPRNRETERPRYAAKVRAYFARHRAGDPEARDLSLMAIAKGAGVSRTPLSNEALICPIIAELLAERATLLRGTAHAAEPAGGAAADSGADMDATGGRPTLVQMRERAREKMLPGLDLLADEAVQKRIRGCLAQAERAMEGWVARHGRATPIDEVGLARHDLEMVAWQLRRVADELGPLVEIREQREMRRHEQDTMSPPAGVAGGGQTTMGF